MNNTKDIFANRKKEVNLFFKKLYIINNRINSGKKNKIYNDDFFKILKSSFILILYNLVESTISSAINDIYQKIEDGKYTYKDVISEIKNMWANNKIKSKNMKTFEIVDDIINSSIVLEKKKLSISGNIDDNKIRNICKEHNITIREKNGEDLRNIKKNRNHLAHGEYSFTDCSRDLTLDDLRKIKNNVLSFMESILFDIEQYYNEELFLEKNLNKKDKNK
ncbi:MAE_28990/MAE_18760 family HEPN-like nuclease [Brachyspira innocens]|uniref:MAE_28990/MAE_18760 family HEPN-like nuclease n=1 Tax=Brachyspira innocens TaxID=13264 RepID=UPI00036C6DBA|nr:MAE_28990/MAE_18760 family HEPN-like nuclease [Brachyspira innocens]